jgi:hypothetical protein
MPRVAISAHYGPGLVVKNEQLRKDLQRHARLH